MSIQRLKYNVQDKMDSRPREKSSSYTVQDESTHYKKKYVCLFFGSLRPAVLSMLTEFCICFSFVILAALLSGSTSIEELTHYQKL